MKGRVFPRATKVRGRPGSDGMSLVASGVPVVAESGEHASSETIESESAVGSKGKDGLSL